MSCVSRNPNPNSNPNSNSGGEHVVLCLQELVAGPTSDRSQAASAVHAPLHVESIHGPLHVDPSVVPLSLAPDDRVDVSSMCTESEASTFMRGDDVANLPLNAAEWSEFQPW